MNHDPTRGRGKDGTPALVCWVDGTLVPTGQARVSVHDRAFRGGEGVFETLRAYGAHPFRLAEHMRRAVDGARELGYALDAAALGRAVLATVDANLAAMGGDDSAVRLTTSPGRIDPHSAFPGTPVDRPTVVVTSQRLHIDPEMYTEGISAITVSLARELPHVKSVSYLTALTARRRARAAGVDEAILVADDGRVLEAAAANLAVVVDGVVHTPPLGDGLLGGITRATVLEVASTLGVTVVERSIGVAALLSADEAFVTATTREVVPLVRIDATTIGTGRPGPTTLALLDGYREAVRRERSERSPTGSPPRAGEPRR